ncbi:MAG: DNRLRE domain-containing protein [Deltaproteobacteria bacterium]|nr:DNRLRE domain-containing protein [Deltaproteobacteria bacterium]
MNWSSTTLGALLATLALVEVGCAPRPRMCTASNECAAQSACVAGRCQPEKANVKPAIDASRRMVVRPVDLAYVRRGEDATVPPLFALGKDSAVLLLRFAVALPESANVVEAYVVLRRSDAVDDDPSPISLHATRIVDGWQGRSTSWGLLPRQAETKAPSTLVEPGGPSMVRLDVRDLVRQWPKHDPRDQGIAVVADNDTRTGTTFALAPSEPFLELYLR